MTDEENRRFSPTGPHISDKWCGIHVIQYQKNELSGHEPNSSEYVLDVCIYDDAQNLLNPSRSSGNSRCWIVNALNGVANIVRLLFIFLSCMYSFISLLPFHFSLIPLFILSLLLSRFLLISIKTGSRLSYFRQRLRHRRRRRRRFHPLFLQGPELGEQWSDASFEFRRLWRREERGEYGIYLPWIVERVMRCILGSSARGVRVALSGVLYSVDRLLTATIKIPIQQYAEMLSRGGWNYFELMVKAISRSELDTHAAR